MAGFNGFVNLILADNELTLNYRGLTNQSLFVESFIGKPGST